MGNDSGQATTLPCKTLLDHLTTSLSRRDGSSSHAESLNLNMIGTLSLVVTVLAQL